MWQGFDPGGLQGSVCEGQSWQTAPGNPLQGMANPHGQGVASQGKQVSERAQAVRSEWGEKM